MISPDFEIHRLRSMLSSKQLPNNLIEDICTDTALSISDAISSILNSAVDECIAFAQSIGASEFAKNIEVSYSGNTYKIGSNSGISDFSKPDIKMLPHLLKNAKQAADGSKYKVIPIAGEDKNNKTNIFDAMLDRQAIVNSKRDDLINRRGDRLQSVNTNSQETVKTINRDIGTTSEFYQHKPHTSKEPTFRTASSKQDPNSKWVIHRQNRDMTSFLMDVNNRIDADITIAINSIISEAERGY